MPTCDCCLMEKADAQVRAGLYPKDAQGKKTDKAFLGFLCDERVCGELLICVENQQFATHRWLTEGFDTADLKDAKALLDELAN